MQRSGKCIIRVLIFFLIFAASITANAQKVAAGKKISKAFDYAVPAMSLTVIRIRTSP